MAREKIASLIVRMGADDRQVQQALASVGQKARSVDADLKKLGNTEIGEKARKSAESLRGALNQITEAQGRVAERAALTARGLEAMGGASKLTDSQLRQVNRTLMDGLNAYKALGQEAPAELRRVADAVKTQLDQPMGMIEKKALALGAAIGTFLGNAAFAVGQQFLAAGKRAFEYAGELSDLNATTDITVEGLQRIEALGVTSGVSLRDLASAVGMLQKNLDNPAAINALGKMGLNYKEIRALEPEQQFLEIAAAVAEIEDPVERANAGAALFGRQWQTIAPAIKGNIKEITDSVKTLSKEQIDALDEAADAWDQFVKDSERGITRWLGNMVLNAKKAELGLVDLLGPFQAIARLQKAHFDREVDFTANLPVDIAQGKDPLRNWETGRARAGRIGAGPVAPAAGEKTIKAMDEALERARQTAAKFQAVQDQLFGRATIAHAEELVRAIGSSENLTRMTTDAQRKLHKELMDAVDVYRVLGRDVPPKLQEILDKTSLIGAKPIVVKAVGAPTLENLTKTFVTYGEIAADGTLVSEDFSLQMIDSQVRVDGFGRALKVNLAPALQRYRIDVSDAKKDTVGFGDAFKSLFQGKGLGDFGKALKGSLGDLREGIFQGFGQMISGGITSLISKGLGLLTQGLGKLWNKFFGTAGRDAVREFAATEGGFDKLHERLLTLGDAGEELWKKLTQGVGRNNAQEAKAAIEEVTAALEAQKQKSEELQESIGTVSEKLGEVTLITPELQTRLEALWNPNTTEGYLTAVRELNDELDRQSQKYDEVKGALEKYGIATKDAGKEFKQITVNRNAQTLLKDFELLKNAGVDVNAIMRGMGKSVREFIKEAQEAGVEVPESMMTVIQTAIDAGEVFDEDGKKITDIKDLGLKFGTTMQEVMAKTIPDAVAKLTKVLEGLAKFLGVELPEAAKEGAEGIEDELEKSNPVIKPRVEWPDFPSVPGPEPQVDGAATGAIVRPWGLQALQPRGTDTVAAMVSPGELILNAAQQANIERALQGGGGGRPMLVIEKVEISGVFSENDLATTLERRFMPAMNEIWERNPGGIRTRSQDVLAVTES